MPNAVSSIIRAATRTPDEPLNILTFPTHERFESCFVLLPHQFYASGGPNIKGWNEQYAPLPGNYTLMNGIYPDLDFDIILSQNKFGQYQIAKRLSDTWQIPLISLEHTLPHPGWDEFHIARLRNLRGHVNVFLSDFSVKAWGWDDDCVIIPPGIDTDIFTPDWVMPVQPVILSVVNDWINRDWACGFQLWKEITMGLKVMVIGDTPGLSKPAKNIPELVGAYHQCQVFLNTSLVSTAPFTLLEAMSCLPQGEMVFFGYTPMPIEKVYNLQTTNQTLKDDVIINKMSRHYSGDLISIKPRYLPECRFTPEHPILIANIGREYDPIAHCWKRVIVDKYWKNASDITLNDWVVVPKIIKHSPLNFSKEWMRFYGLYIAKGCLVNGQIQFTFREEETSFIDEIRNIASQLNRNITLRRVGEEKAVRVTFIHAALARKLGDMFHSKNLPKEFIEASPQEIEWFLEAYGYQIDEYRRHITTTSTCMAYQLVLLLNKIGYMPCITFKGRYGIWWTKTHTNRKRFYVEDDENFYLPIKELKKIPYSGNVYNFTTNSHVFQTPFIQTHNCGKAVVSTATSMIPQIIQDGVNGFISNSPRVLRGRCEQLLANPELCRKLGREARTTIEENFSFRRMAADWNRVLQQTSNEKNQTTH